LNASSVEVLEGGHLIPELAKAVETKARSASVN
jgi:hypothetical protein